MCYSRENVIDLGLKISVLIQVFNFIIKLWQGLADVHLGLLRNCHNQLSVLFVGFTDRSNFYKKLYEIYALLCYETSGTKVNVLVRSDFADYIELFSVWGFSRKFQLPISNSARNLKKIFTIFDLID